MKAAPKKRGMLLGFQKRFVPKIEAGEKTHTIRGDRKNEAEVGGTLHLYTGLRQKGARLLMRTICVKKLRIAISLQGIRIDDEVLSDTEINALAVRDGFENWGEMVAFWMDRIPAGGWWTGKIYHWRKSCN